jgi:maltose-binding protein MalE
VKFEYVEGAERRVPRAGQLSAEGKKYSDLYWIDATYNGKVYALPGDVKNWTLWLNNSNRKDRSRRPR